MDGPRTATGMIETALPVEPRQKGGGPRQASRNFLRGSSLLLVGRVLALLSPVERAEWDAGTAELRRAVEHPHPLGVEGQDGGTCNACNTPFDVGEALLDFALQLHPHPPLD